MGNPNCRARDYYILLNFFVKISALCHPRVQPRSLSQSQFEYAPQGSGNFLGLDCHAKLLAPRSEHDLVAVDLDVRRQWELVLRHQERLAGFLVVVGLAHAGEGSVGNERADEDALPHASL